ARSKTVAGGAVRRAGAGDGDSGSPIVVTDAKQEVTVSQFVAQLELKEEFGGKRKGQESTTTT
ncbi:hypothetical protein ACJX0J_008253, partial [Zea mays]